MIAEADELLPIGEVARQTGVSLSAIRYYETLGLVSAVAREGGRRRFDEATVRRLRVITTVQNAGFTLDLYCRNFLSELTTVQWVRMTATRVTAVSTQ